MEHQITSVMLRSRIKLQYVEQGNRSGVPIVLLHGYTDSCRSFELLLPHLPKSLHAYALTQRGHGEADRPVTGYDAYDFAADLAAFMDELGIERAIIVGHSMGSQIAQRFAIDHPGRTLALVLMGAFSTLGGNRAVEALWDSAVSTLKDPVEPDFVREFQESTLAGPIPAAFLDAIVAESRKVPARVWRAALQGQMQTDVSAELARIKAPTLIIWGDKDGICARKEQDRLATAIRGSTFVSYAGTGHGVHWEQPKRVAVDLRAFVERAVHASVLAR
jgi:pimeloyl-ACP methyl ester carboxylesterase